MRGQFRKAVTTGPLKAVDPTAMRKIETILSELKKTGSPLKPSCYPKWRKEKRAVHRELFL